MITLAQSPVDDGFVQNPYAFYAHAREHGDLFFWQDYNRICAVSARAVNTLLRDRRWGREIPAEFANPTPPHIEPFMEIEHHSMLELEPPRHTRLRNQVVRAFTSRRIAHFGPETEALAHLLIDRFEGDTIDLLPSFCAQIPVTMIARLLGVPEAMNAQLLNWSHDMVGMYQANRDREIEDRAVTATQEFASFIRDHISAKRKHSADDLISTLLQGEMSSPELTTTCILLLNAGHEATAHALGNSIKTILQSGLNPAKILTPERLPATIEECLRFDPPVHLFERHAYEEMTLFGHDFKRGDTVALLLGAANRDPELFKDPDCFQPNRAAKPHAAFGAGIHFCIGAPLARIEMAAALPVLFDRLPKMALARTPRYSNKYHFHGLERLRVYR